MIGGIFVLYPIFTYSDGTEVTASKPNAEKQVFLYIEKFDIQKDSFINATIVLPGAKIQSSSGYSEVELDEMVGLYSEIQDDILDYVMEKG